MKIRVQINDQTYEVEVGDLNARPIKAVVDGETFEVWPEDNVLQAGLAAAPSVRIAAPVAATAATPVPVPAHRAAAPSTGSGNASKQVVAPIPGTILSVSVKEGQEVSFGQELATLEAMKMKSAIRANRAGKIGAIHVAAGDKVGQNQALMDWAD
jgi:biotin carboxyl carrier protein